MPRRDAVLVVDRLRCHAGQVRDALAGVEHGGALADQLERVAVPGADQHLEAVCFGLRRERADDVVRLVPDLLQGDDG